MQSSIERIINNDRKAREAVAAAERHRKESAQMLADGKEKYDSLIRNEISGAADAARIRCEKESERLSAERRKNAEKIMARMDSVYKEKKDQWIETYTLRIIGK